MRNGSHHRRQFGADTRLITISAIVLRDQAPERAIELGQFRIGSVEHVLDVIEEPVAHIFDAARAVQICADHAFKLIYERHHDASL